ncbi:hypothetical protein [Thermogutta sp.]|uniref:COG1470 family protein n=1 Tax=Thermogutta sp. TaxID=1962930 RepID=UPI00322094A4
MRALMNSLASWRKPKTRATAILTITVLGVVFASSLPIAAENGAVSPENSCTNGSFEILGKNGFPVDWGPVGREVSLSSDAHSGKYALRLVRTAETATPETGLNRTRLITELKGGIDFWYKAVSAEGAQLNIYVIPVNEEGIERTGSPRATFTIPEDHIGDGHWHHARLKYDYTDNPKVKSVHFAARIVGTAGELLLDDFQYVAKVGPVPHIKKVLLEEDPQTPGREARIRVLLANAGDRPADNVEVTISLPGQVRDRPKKTTVPRLAPDEIRPLYFAWTGVRDRPTTLLATAVCGELQDVRRLELKPALRVRSFGPAEPVVTVGQTVVLECELENTGQVNVGGITVTFETPQGATRQVVKALFPTRRTVVRHTFVADAETPNLPVKVSVQAKDVPITESSGGVWSGQSRVIVVKSISPPPPLGRFSVAPRPIPVLENENLRLVFYPCQQRFFAGRLEVKTPQGWKAAGWLVSMGRLVLRDSDGHVAESLLAAKSCQLGPSPTGSGGVLVFPCTVKTPDGATITATVRFSLDAGSNTCRLDAQLESDRSVDILAWGLPMVYIHQRDEAVFPGLEWLVDDELSSDSLDIAEDHPDRIRYVVHPNMITIPAVGIHGPHGTVGLIWENRPVDDRFPPAFAFASPDRFNHQRSHLMELFLPPVPEFTPVNSRVASKAYTLESNRPLRLTANLWTDGQASDALAIITDFVKSRKIGPAHPLPHTSLAGEIVFSTRAYLESLWDPETHQWWTTKGNALLSRQALPPDFAADLVLGSMLTDDQNLKKRCEERLAEVCGRIKLPPRLDALRMGGRADQVWANANRVAALLASRREDGTWRFDADWPGSGPFVGMDYRELGPHEALEVGTCARNAYEILAFARITGDWGLYEEMVKTLELMETFRVPRAAQVWEVPVHTPDILAAADAVDAYIEAYRLSGEKRWLQDAVLWAKRGLPFVYLWSDPQKPFLQGASIPVFGATWYRGSWFGRPVQWNGLRYAYALLKLAEYDQSLPWKELATILIHSAIHQQDQEGENVALWPDNISAITGEKCPWVFAPRQIIGCITKLIGRDEEPRSVYAGPEDQRFALTSLGRIDQVRWGGETLEFQIKFPPGEVGPVLIANIARPQEVAINGEPIHQSDQPHVEDGSAWCYDPGSALLTVQVGATGPVTVSIKPAVYRTVDRIPRLAKLLTFTFDAGLEGWIAAHDVTDLAVKDSTLVGRITGPDPYIIRPNLRIPAAAYKTVVIRMSTTAGRMAQLFWATERSPNFDEEKSLRFAVEPDGQLHDYRLSLADHPDWNNQIIVALRLDPGGGTAEGQFQVDAILGE